MPAVVTLIAQDGTIGDSLLPQNLPLLLPSGACTDIVVPPILLEHEWRLRQAQALDALTDLRGHLEVRAYVYRYKDQHVRGQRETLRSRDIVNGIESKIKLDASRYRTAYSALTALSGALCKLDWRQSTGLQPLLDSDIRHVSAGDGSGSEGRRELSWIWKVGNMSSDLASSGANINLQEGASLQSHT